MYALDTDISAEEFKNDILPTLNAGQIREKARNFPMKIELSQEDLPQVFDKLKTAIDFVLGVGDLKVTTLMRDSPINLIAYNAWGKCWWPWMIAVNEDLQSFDELEQAVKGKTLMDIRQVILENNLGLEVLPQDSNLLYHLRQ